MDSSLRDLLDRYGPAAALVVALVLLVTLLPGNVEGGGSLAAGDGATGPADEAATVGSESATQADTSGAGDAGATGTGSGTRGRSATSAAGTGTSGSGADGGSSSGAGGGSGRAPATGPTCRPDGRQAGISIYMPPCRAVFSGDNGGATARGVFADHVNVALYVAQSDAATEAALSTAGVGDTTEEALRIMEVLRHYFDDHYETYGREVRVTTKNASAAASDEAAAKADADRIADDGFFAVMPLGLTTGSPAFDTRIAERGVICVTCSLSLADSFYRKTKGYNFGILPTMRQYYRHVAEYWGKRLVGGGRLAKWAGAPASPADVDLRKQPRKFGLIWLNANNGTVEPGLTEERDYFVNELLPRYGITDVVDSSYNYDPTQGPTEAQTIIARMNTSHVTTIAVVGAEPVFPIFFTREATKEQYYPEWFVSGTGLTDTTLFGRTYDPQQWQHAYGISPLRVFWKNVSVSDGYREYHHVCPQVSNNCSPGDEGGGINTYDLPLTTLFTGIMTAGPKLTPQTFAQGMYDYPATGGVAAFPRWKVTPTAPVFYDDFTEVWWDGSQTGTDEVNQQGAGVLMKANNGKRYTLGQWPATEPNMFEPAGAVYTSDGPYTGPDASKHEQDGHTHPNTQKCLSCK